MNEFPERSNVESCQPGSQLLDQLCHLVDTDQANQVSLAPAQLLRARVRLELPLVLHLKPCLHGVNSYRKNIIAI